MTGGQRRVQKFRSGEAMNEAPPLTRAGADFARFLRHCARYRAFSRREHPRGVFKFRSIEDAQRAREQASGSS